MRFSIVDFEAVRIVRALMVTLDEAVMMIVQKNFDPILNKQIYWNNDNLYSA